MWTWGWGPCGQYISKKRPSRFVILSAAKDLCRARDPSLRSELALERSEGMTLLKRLRLTRKTASLKCIVPCGCPAGFCHRPAFKIKICIIHCMPILYRREEQLPLRERTVCRLYERTELTSSPCLEGQGTPP